MSLNLGDLAARLELELLGDASLKVTGVAALVDAAQGEISFLASDRYLEAVKTTCASAVVVPHDFSGDCSCALLKAENPDAAFAAVADLLGPPDPVLPAGVHPSAVVADDAELDESARIGPLCVIESGARIGAEVEIWAGSYVGHEATIGAGTKIYPNVTVRERVAIGERVILQSGCVIGSDGFGYVNVAGAWEKIRQVGTVVVGDDVEIGANVTVDRARFGQTVIGRGSKIDNLVQIAHNVHVGEHCAFASQVGIAGSAEIGNHVQMGGQSGSGGHLTIGDHSVVGGRGGVTKDVPAKTFVSGFPAMPHNQARRLHAHMARLPEWKKKINDFENRLKRLEDTGAQ